MNRRLSASLLLGVVLAVSALVALALAGGSNGVALAEDDVPSPTPSSPTFTEEGITTVPQEPLVMLDEYIAFTAVFTTPDFSPPYTADWNWGDATSSSCRSDSNPDDVGNSEACRIGKIVETEYLVTGSHSYTEPGVFAVQLTVTEVNGGSGEPVFQYVVAYDPTGGFVTGGGWIDSPAGACNFGPCTEDTAGKATFGFVSKYKKGASEPDGNTQFQFKAGDLSFHSDSYDWLVVNQKDSNAQFKGSGAINGAGDYKFMLWAGDKDPDTFRIKIWVGDDEDDPVYDNGVAQPIGGGSIVIHKGKGK